MSLLLTVRPPGESPIPVGRLPEGDRGIEATVAAMRRVVADAVRSGVVFGVARQLSSMASVPERYPWKVEEFLRAGIVYADDPQGQEMLQMPETLLDAIDRDGTARGDCDDVAMLGAALLYVAGWRPVFIVVGRTPRRQGGRLEHVYYGFLRVIGRKPTPQNVVPFDPQERQAPGVWRDAFARVRIHTVFA